MQRNRLLPALFVAGLLAGLSMVGTTLGHFPTTFSLTSVAAVENSNAGHLIEPNSLQEHGDVRGDEPAAVEPKQISDDVLFDMFLIKVVSLENAARKSQAKGESGRIWSKYLQRNGFSEREAASIRQIANEHAEQIAPVHAKALQVIQNARKAEKAGKSMPPAPPELQAFQERRYAIVKLSREKLMSRLGNETVEKARSLMKANSRELPTDPATLGGQYRQERFRQRVQDFKRTEGGRAND